MGGSSDSGSDDDDNYDDDDDDDSDEDDDDGDDDDDSGGVIETIEAASTGRRSFITQFILLYSPFDGFPLIFDQTMGASIQTTNWKWRCGKEAGSGAGRRRMGGGIVMVGERGVEWGWLWKDGRRDYDRGGALKWSLGK